LAVEEVEPVFNGQGILGQGAGLSGESCDLVGYSTGNGAVLKNLDRGPATCAGRFTAPGCALGLPGAEDRPAEEHRVQGT
jgi:hypothetical protein